jgi:uncharacterized membrane protein
MKLFLTLLTTGCLLALPTGLVADSIHTPRDVSETAPGAPRLVVPDPDTKDGSAQAAVPGQSKPGSTICSMYSYDRSAGLYQVTWRVKIDDNTITGVVFRASTHDESGHKGYKGGTIAVKGTDFKEAGKYQDFSYTAEKGEGGFFGVGSTWGGKGRVHVDTISTVAQKTYSEKEQLERMGVTIPLPETWLLPRPTPPTVHLAKGLWWDFFGLSEAMADLGGATFKSSYLGSGQYGRSLRNFPSSVPAFMECNLIVLANVDAQALGVSGRFLLDEYVRNGGALLVCGGPFALERGGYAGTALAGLLPCELTGKDRLKAEGGLPLQPTADAKGVLPDDLSWSLAPRVFYYHEVAAKPGAKILMRAGDKPMLLTWQVGKGRVAVLAASPEGEAGAGQMAFWQWGDMPRLTAAISRWLVDGQGSSSPAALSAETKGLLDELFKPSLNDDAAKQEELIRALLSRCHDRVFAKNLLDASSNFTGTPDRAVVTALARAVQPYVDAEFEPQAKRLIQSGNEGLAALGLQVLGMCRGKEAGSVILSFLETGSAALQPGGAGDDGKLDSLMAMNSGMDIGADQRLKLAAVIALGSLGDPAHLNALRRITSLYSKKSVDPLTVGDVVDIEENLLQQSLVSRVRLGDGTAISPFLDQVLRNSEQIESFLNALDTMLPPNDPAGIHAQKMARLRLPPLRQRQALCMDMLRRLPVSVYPDLVAAVAKRNDEALIPFAYAAMALRPGDKLPPDVAAALLPLAEKCRLPAIRLLALNIAASVGDPGINRQIAELLGRLGTSPDSADRLFALRRAAGMLPADRARVLAAALQDPDPKLQHLAQASQALLPGGPTQGGVK